LRRNRYAFAQFAAEDFDLDQGKLEFAYGLVIGGPGKAEEHALPEIQGTPGVKSREIVAVILFKGRYSHVCSNH